MLIHWLEQTDSDLPSSNDWLGACERACLDRMIFLKRRSDWRLGRWTAKRAVATFLELPMDIAALASIEIRAASSGAPEVFLNGQTAPVSISLSHRDGVALCTVAPESAFGCDLETVEKRSHAFVTDYFTTDERSFIENAKLEDQAQLATLLWSAKESTLKALRVGLRVDTRDVSVRVPRTSVISECWMEPIPLAQASIDTFGWRSLKVSHAGTEYFEGWWRLQNHLVRTIVCTA